MGTINLSIIVPCYNEGIKLLDNIAKIKQYLTLNNISNYEIIIVNDGSKDNTDEICLNIKEEENIMYCSYSNNRGKGGAVKEGIKNSSGKWIIFMDADLSTNLKAIKEVIENKDRYDVIIGSRRHRDTILVKKQGLLRRVTGKSCSILTNIFIPLNLADTQCGFKAFEGDFAREMINKQTLNGFAFDVEYLYMAKLNNKKILEIGVEWENDEDSKVSVFNSSIKFFKDLIYIRKNKKLYKGD